MKPTEYRRGTALRVTWVDSTESSGWMYEKTPAVHVEEVTTTGHFVNSTDKGLNMTSTLSKLGGVLGLVTIPWQSVTSIQEI